MKLRDALTLARSIGLEVRHRRGTDELFVTDGGRPMVVKMTVKDAPKALVLYIRKRQGLVGTQWRKGKNA